MALIIDTNIAILLRDGDEGIASRVSALDEAPMISILSRVELEGGVYRGGVQTDRLRTRLDTMLKMVTQLPFGVEDARIYGSIVERLGYSRPLIIDRMIAAQALSTRSTLATLNYRDFRDIPDLQVEDWTG